MAVIDQFLDIIWRRPALAWWRWAHRDTLRKNPAHPASAEQALRINQLERKLKWLL